MRSRILTRSGSNPVRGQADVSSEYDRDRLGRGRDWSPDLDRRSYHNELRAGRRTGPSPGSRSPPEDAANAPADRAQHASDRALGALFQVALVHRAEPGRNVVAVLEIFEVGRAALDRTLIGNAAQFLGVQPRRGSETWSRADDGPCAA